MKMICPSCETETKKLYPYKYYNEVRRVCKGCIEYFNLNIIPEENIILVEKVIE